MQIREMFQETWAPMTAFPPESCETYEVRLPDGTQQRAFWSGKAWWLHGQVVTPVGWRICAADVVAA